jgi:hypothetical protein
VLTLHHVLLVFLPKSVEETRDYCDFGIYPLSGILRDTTFLKLDLFSSSGVGWEAPTLLGPLERTIIAHQFALEHRMTDKVQKSSNPACHAPSSELFRTTFVTSFHIWPCRPRGILIHLSIRLTQRMLRIKVVSPGEKN